MNTTSNHPDPAKILRRTVGFDHIANMIEMALQPGNADGGFPPYNISKSDDDTYNVSLAVAGFSSDELDIEQRNSMLVVTGKHVKSEDTVEFMHRGITGRDFERQFQLAEHMLVMDAKLVDGILSIDLKREVPEEKRPRSIPIGKAKPAKTKPAK